MINDENAYQALLKLITKSLASTAMLFDDDVVIDDGNTRKNFCAKVFGGQIAPSQKQLLFRDFENSFASDINGPGI